MKTSKKDSVLETLEQSSGINTALKMGIDSLSNRDGINEEEISAIQILLNIQECNLLSIYYSFSQLEEEENSSVTGGPENPEDQNVNEDIEDPDFITPTEYFCQLPDWDGTDHIQKLCDTLEVGDPGDLYNSLSKWLADSIAPWIKSRSINPICICFKCNPLLFEDWKRDWLKLLCPEPLQSSSFLTAYSGNNYNMGKEVLIDCFMINTDSMKLVEWMIENSTFNMRIPYENKTRTHYRKASILCCTISLDENRFKNPDLVKVIDVEKIDIQHALSIDMDLVWAQAYDLHKKAGINADKPDKKAIFPSGSTFPQENEESSPQKTKS